MIALLLAIAASGTLALVLKASELRDLNRYAVTLINYATACLGGAVMMQGAGLSLPLDGLGDRLPRLLDALGAGPVPAALAPTWAMSWGVLTGALLFAGLISYQIALRHHGVGLAAAMAKLGVLVPMVLSLMIWGEQPAPLQWLGVALALSALALANWPPPGTHWYAALQPALLAAFVCVGLAEFGGKVFQALGQVSHKPIFLACAFGAAGVVALFAVLIRRRGFGLAEVIVGVCVGVPNLFSIGFLVDALDALPATVVFPALGAGAVLLIQLAGVVLFGETPDRREWAAVGLTAAALVAINL